MSNVSIYQNSWIDLVFEDRNKEYGAYQLRKNSVKTTLIALFCGMLFVVFVSCIPLFLKFISAGEAESPSKREIPKLGTFIQFQPKKPATPKQSMLPPTKAQALKTVQTATLSRPAIVDKTPDATITPTNSALVTIASANGSNSGEPSNVAVATSSENGTETAIVDASKILTINELDKNPAFPGGIKVFLNYVGSNFRTPDVEMEQTVKVFVSFIVEIDGTMSAITVENDPGYGLGKEAIRVLKSLKTKWEPGQKDGQKVRTMYNLPISVRAHE